MLFPCRQRASWVSVTSGPAAWCNPWHWIQLLPTHAEDGGSSSTSISSLLHCDTTIRGKVPGGAMVHVEVLQGAVMTMRPVVSCWSLGIASCAISRDGTNFTSASAFEYILRIFFIQFVRIHLSIASSILTISLWTVTSGLGDRNQRSRVYCISCSTFLCCIAAVQCCSAGCSVLALQRWEPGAAESHTCHLSRSGHWTPDPGLGTTPAPNINCNYHLQLATNFRDVS